MQPSIDLPRTFGPCWRGQHADCPGTRPTPHGQGEVCACDCHQVPAQLSREIAAADLYHAAKQYTVVAGQVGAGDSTQEMLRDRQAALLGAALLYAAACGYTAPTPGGTVA